MATSSARSPARAVPRRASGGTGLDVRTRNDTLSMSYRELGLGGHSAPDVGRETALASGRSSPVAEWTEFSREFDARPAGETAPLVDGFSGYLPGHDEQRSKTAHWLPSVLSRAKATLGKPLPWRSVGKSAAEIAAVLPAVLLGLTLNVLDCMSYGILLFPAGNPLMPPTAKALGINMFLTSTALAQLVYTGMSRFRGANGSMMIEVMPFLHAMATAVSNRISPDGVVSATAHVEVVVTTLAAYAASTVLTGIVFLALGYWSLGRLVAFFPRHILIACIGGIGVFLILTALEVTSGVSSAGLSPGEFMAELFTARAARLWGTSLAAAVAHKALQHTVRHPLVTPAFFVAVPALFYAVLGISGTSLADARDSGWLFGRPGPGDGTPPPSQTPTDPALGHIVQPLQVLALAQHLRWDAFAETIWTMLALVFFSLLHVPINVPALAVSTKQEIHMNRELLAHGVSNLAAGAAGTLQNYLVYTNSLLYIRAGGAPESMSTGGVAAGGVLLALGTVGMMGAGDAVIGFVPVVLVGGLIFVLGIDLVQEGLVSTWGRVSTFEYATMVLIILVMAVLGFSQGILAGIVLACVSFVLAYSQKRVVLSVCSGRDARSTVHRLFRQRLFLDACADLVCVVRLQGYLFFGTVGQVTRVVRTLLDDAPARGARRPRYLILDLAGVNGVDYSALEALDRLCPAVGARGTRLLLSGWSGIGKELRKMGLVSEADAAAASAPLQSPLDSRNSLGSAGAEGASTAFSRLDTALEWCENDLLSVYYDIQMRSVQSGPAQALDASPELGPAVKVGPRTASRLTMELQRSGDGAASAVAIAGGSQRALDNGREASSVESSCDSMLASPRDELVRQAAQAIVRAEPVPTDATAPGRVSTAAAGREPLTVLHKAFFELLPQSNTAARHLFHELLEGPMDAPVDADKQAQREFAFFGRLAERFVRERVPAGTVLADVGDPASACFVIETGALLVLAPSVAPDVTVGQAEPSVVGRPGVMRWLTRHVSNLRRRRCDVPVAEDDSRDTDQLLPGPSLASTSNSSNVDLEAAGSDLSNESTDPPEQRRVSLFTANEDVAHLRSASRTSLHGTNALGDPENLLETLIPGTMVGLLPLVTAQPSTTRLVAPHPAIVWRLSRASLLAWSRADPQHALAFVSLALSFDAQRLQQLHQIRRVSERPL